MQKKLTITVDEDVYDGLYKIVGRRKISQFITDLVRPHVIGADLEAGYTAMAADEAREAEAEEWANVLSEDVADETR
jgi:predicted CopG family antitoxin